MHAENLRMKACKLWIKVRFEYCMQDILLQKLELYLKDTPTLDFKVLVRTDTIFAYLFGLQRGRMYFFTWLLLPVLLIQRTLHSVFRHEKTSIICRKSEEPQAATGWGFTKVQSMISSYCMPKKANFSLTPCVVLMSRRMSFCCRCFGMDAYKMGTFFLQNVGLKSQTINQVKNDKQK